MNSRRIGRWAATLVLIVMAVSSFARAQGSRYDNIVLSPQGKPVAAATVAVCTAAASTATTPCSPLANVYTDATLATPAANPLTADGLGNYGFWAPPGKYLVQIYGSGITTKVNTVILPCDPSSNCTMGTSSTISAFSLNLSGNLSVAGALTASGSGNTALKPAVTDALQFVSPNGSDANDGLSWGTAKLTIYAALTSLPGGSASSKLAGAGTIFVTQGNSSSGIVVNANAGCTTAGIWILGPADPNAGAIPNCWLKETGAVSIIGFGFTNPANGPAGPTVLVQPTKAQGNPVLWLSGVGFRYLFKGLTFSGSIPFRIGVDSNGSRNTNAGAGPTTFQNCSFRIIFGTAQDGPGWDVGPNVIWLWADHISIDALGQITYNISTISRSSNVVTVTTTAAHTFSVGQNVVIAGVTDTSYLGTFAITAVTSTTFTYSQTGANSSSSGGTAGLAPGNDNRAAVLDSTGASGSASGLIYFQDAVFNGGGGVRFYNPASGSASFYLEHVLQEGSGNTQPMFEAVTAIGSSTRAFVRDVSIADAFDNPPVVRVAQGSFVDAVTVECGPGTTINGIDVEGPARLVNCGVTGTPAPFLSTAQVASPLAKGQVGTFLGRNYYQQDDYRRSFGPLLVRFANNASQLPSAWTVDVGTVTITSGKTAPDNTTNAALVSSTADGGSGFSDVEMASFNHNFSVGDYVVAGVWAKAAGLAISSISRSAGVVTVTTSANHNYAVNQSVGIYDVSGSTVSFNGNFTIASVPTGTTFTVTQGGPNESGTVTNAFVTQGPYGNTSGNGALWVGFPFASLSNINVLTLNASNKAGTDPTNIQLSANGSFQDDGAWQWLWLVARVTSTDGSSIGVHMRLRCSKNKPMLYYAPTLLILPASSINSDSEAAEIALAMGSPPDNLSSGATVATMRGVSLAFGGSGNFHGILTHANTANRTYTFPDVTGNVVLDSAAQTLSAKTVSSPTLSGHLNQSSANGDIAGQISISAATSGSKTFGTAYTSAPVCVASPTSNPGSTTWWVTTSATAVTINLSASSTITFNYACKGNPN